MSLANLPKWTGDASNLTGLARKRSSSAETATWESDPAAGAEVAYLDGGATEIEPDGITQPGERLRVYNLAGYGEPLLLSEVLISSKSLAKEAAALAFMRRSPYDIRPSLLLLMHAQDLREAAACLRYGANYLNVCRARHQLRVSDEAINAASVDALGLLYRARGPRVASRQTSPLCVPASKTRAKSLVMRDSEYIRLRKILLSTFQARYLEAIVAFAKACGTDVGKPAQPIPLRRRRVANTHSSGSTRRPAIHSAFGSIPRARTGMN